LKPAAPFGITIAGIIGIMAGIAIGTTGIGTTGIGIIANPQAMRSRRVRASPDAFFRFRSD
jgi:hypothetical protein